MKRTYLNNGKHEVQQHNHQVPQLLKKIWGAGDKDSQATVFCLKKKKRFLIIIF